MEVRSMLQLSWLLINDSETIIHLLLNESVYLDKYALVCAIFYFLMCHSKLYMWWRENTISE